MSKTATKTSGKKTYTEFEFGKDYALFKNINDDEVKGYRVRVKARGKVTFADGYVNEVVNCDIIDGDGRKYATEVYATVMRSTGGENIIFTVNNTKYEVFAWCRIVAKRGNVKGK